MAEGVTHCYYSNALRRITDLGSVALGKKLVKTLNLKNYLYATRRLSTPPPVLLA